MIGRRRYYWKNDEGNKITNDTTLNNYRIDLVFQYGTVVDCSIDQVCCGFYLGNTDESNKPKKNHICVPEKGCIESY